MNFYDRVYGEIIIEDPFVLKIIDGEYFQRLKGINQYGGINYAFKGQYTTTRFEHSIGVYYLLNSLGADYETQIAGLLHDSGHAPLSHLLERVDEWKDFEHKSFLNWPGSDEVVSLLSEKGIKIRDFSEYKLIKQKLPKIGADRIDYGIRDFVAATGQLEGIGTRILSSLKIVEDEIVFTNLAVAEEFAKIAFESLDLIVHNDKLASYYGAFQNIYEKAYKAKLIDEKYILDNFLIDSDLIKFMNSFPDVFAFEIDVIDHKYNFIPVLEGEDYDIIRTVDKIRLFDPTILVTENKQKLSEISEEFFNYFAQKEVYFQGKMVNYYKIT